MYTKNINQIHFNKEIFQNPNHFISNVFENNFKSEYVFAVHLKVAFKLHTFGLKAK